MRNKIIALIINTRITNTFNIRIKISQNSSLSLILYLFYNADLLKMCEKSKSKTNVKNFVNDVNILTYNINIEKNCKTFEKFHKKCKKWTKRHDSVFALQKYEFIHFVKNSKKFNMTKCINIANNKIVLKSNIKMFGLQINRKLK